MVDAETSGETSPLLGAGADDRGANGNDSGCTTSGSKDAWAQDFDGLPWYKRPSVYWLIGPYFLFTLAFGGVLVPRINLIVDLVCRDYMADKSLLDPSFIVTPIVLGGDNPQCQTPAVQRNVATFTLMTSVLTGALSALTAPKLGSLSDRYGRNRLLAIASIGGVLNEIVTILCAKYPESLDYHWILFGAFLDGITGSFTAGGIIGTAYTSDCSSPSKRGVYIGYLQACLFTGVALGPLIAGYLVKWTGTLLSIFYVALASHIIFMLFIWLVMPESLSKKRQMLARQKHRQEEDALAERLHSRVRSRLLLDWLPAIFMANPLAPLKMLVPGGAGHGRLRRNMIILAFMDTIILSVAIGSGAVTILYIEYMFHWGVFDASRYVSLMSFVRVVALLGVFPLVNYIFRVRPLQRRRRESGLHILETNSGMDELDVWLLRIALVSDVTGIIGYCLVRTPQLFIMSGVLTSFGGLGGAVIQSSITKHVPAERVGSLLGALGLLHALGRVFAPMMFNGIYAATVETFPQAFFVLLAALFGLALIGSLFIRPHLYLKEDGYAPGPTSTAEAHLYSDCGEEEAVAEGDIAAGALPRV
ncbi:hypothetical protein PG999_008852 [Apiospora kogelbergensis]|uniref:Major facilitator superfamily (MFS) profile domain-containing protein n=1 Tax=Apiospora kogelbergensis TaxID=1337665 RepID=A0AAW0QLR9_9PEZI